MNKTLFVCFILFFFSSVTLTFSNESVEELEKQKDDIYQEIDSKKSEKDALSDDLDTLLTEMSYLKSKLQHLKNDIASIKKDIKDKNSKIRKAKINIENLERELIDKEKELEKKKITIEKNLKTMYSKGDVMFLEFLFRSEDISDFLYRANLLNDILDEHESLFDIVKKDIRSINNQKKELSNQKKELETQKDALELILSDLDKKKVKQEDLLLDVQLKRNSIKNKINQSNEIIEQLIHEQMDLNEQIKHQKEIERKQKELEQNPPQNNNPIITGNDVIDIAYKWVEQRGKGSSNPVIYSMPKRQLDMVTYGDCSTFSRRIFLDAGYGDIGLNTAFQISNPDGHYIEDLSNLKPGDLMYFGPTGTHGLYSYLPDGRKVTTSHVALYVGNEQMIDLSSSVGSIAVKSFSDDTAWSWYVKNRFVGAKRFSK